MSATFALQRCQPAAGRDDPARKQPTAAVRGARLGKGTRKPSRPCLPEEKGVSPSLLGIIPPQTPHKVFFSSSSSSGTQRYPHGLSRSLESASRGCFQVGHWGGRAAGRSVPEVPSSAMPHPSPAGHPSEPRPPQGDPRGDRPLAYPRAQRGSHGGRAAAPGGWRGQRSAAPGLRAAPWPGAGLPRRPECRGRSWPAPLRAAGG